MMKKSEKKGKSCADFQVWENGMIKKSEKKAKAILITLPPQILARLDGHKDRTGISRSAIIACVLSAVLKDETQDKKV